MPFSLDSEFWVVQRKNGTLKGGHMSVTPKLYHSEGVAKRWATDGDAVRKVRLDYDLTKEEKTQLENM